MVEAYSLADRVIGFLVIGVVTWWVVAPKSYIACIRKLPWLWMGAYPLNTKAWFPRYLRLIGVFIWAIVLVCLYWYRSRPH